MNSAVFKKYWDKAKTSIWLIPTALCLLAVALAAILLDLERDCNRCLALLPDLDMGVGAARDLMGVIATSFLSVGGVSFSVTMVALTLTSGQYGPKVLRHFLGDTRNKLSLGLFFATAVYALAVSISLSSGDKPRLSIVIALALAMLALIEFIGFIHRTASDLQADQLIQRLGRQLRGDMRRLRSSEATEGRDWSTRPWRRAARDGMRKAVRTEKEGYVQTIDFALMAETLQHRDSVALLRVRPGDFLVSGLEVMALWVPDGTDEHALADNLSEAITMGPIRTPIQDPEFPITQIQQIAARALSTGINDPGTAITCVDWLTLALAEVVDRDLPGRVVLDTESAPRLLIRPIDFAYLMQLVFTPMRQFTSQDLQVCNCLLESLTRLASLTERRDRLALLHAEGTRVWEQICAEKHASHDVGPAQQRYRRLCSQTT